MRDGGVSLRLSPEFSSLAADADARTAGAIRFTRQFPANWLVAEDGLAIYTTTTTTT